MLVHSMKLKLNQNFEKINSNAVTSQYLNKFDGEWFNMSSDYDQIIPNLKEGISLNEIEDFAPNIRDIIFSLITNGIIKLSDNKSEKKISPERDQVTLIIIEALSFCNLACTYCFEDVPTKGFKMSFKTAETIVKSIENLNLANNFTIEFNGGESFSNLPVLKHIVNQVSASNFLKQFNIRYSVTSNSTFLNDEILQFLKENWISVTVSLDGIREDHDAYRVYSNGKGSFDKVLKTLKKYDQAGISYNTISVISSADQIYRAYNFFKKRRIPRIALVLRRHSDRLPLSSTDYKAIAEAHYHVFKDSFNSFKKGVFAPIILDYAVLIKNILKPHDPDYMCLRTPCGAGKNMITYDTKGDIYACQDLIKEPTFKICSSLEANPQEIIDNHPVVRKLLDRKPGGNSGCEDCNWQNFCQGGCFSTSYFSSGKNFESSLTKRTPHCEYFYHSFEYLMKDFIASSRNLMEYAYLNKNIGD